MQVGPSCLDFGLVEVVAESVGGDVCAVGACDDEVRRLLAFACFIYEFSELWGYGLGRVACGCLRVLELAVLVGGMADPQSLRLRIPVLHLQADDFAYSEV